MLIYLFFMLIYSYADLFRVNKGTSLVLQSPLKIVIRPLHQLVWYQSFVNYIFNDTCEEMN